MSLSRNVGPRMSIQNLPKYAYFPFGGGPRQCIGNYFAMMEVVLLLATIGQRFKFSLDERSSGGSVAGAFVATEERY